MSSSFPNPLTEKEEQYYVKLLEENDPDARLVLIERNLRLVAHIAKKYAGISPSLIPRIWQAEKISDCFHPILPFSFNEIVLSDKRMASANLACVPQISTTFPLSFE